MDRTGCQTMNYMLIGYKYNKKEQEVARFEQKFDNQQAAEDKLIKILPNFENYEIYKDGKIVKTNFKRVQ